MLGEHHSLHERVTTANVRESNRRPPVSRVGCVSKCGNGYYGSENDHKGHQYYWAWTERLHCLHLYLRPTGRFLVFKATKKSDTHTTDIGWCEAHRRLTYGSNRRSPLLGSNKALLFAEETCSRDGTYSKKCWPRFEDNAGSTWILHLLMW